MSTKDVKFRFCCDGFNGQPVTLEFTHNLPTALCLEPEKLSRSDANALESIAHNYDAHVLNASPKSCRYCKKPATTATYIQSTLGLHKTESFIELVPIVTCDDSACRDTMMKHIEDARKLASSGKDFTNAPGKPKTKCSYCGKEMDGLRFCARCKQIVYCGKECQENDWPRHKNGCKEMANERLRTMAEAEGR